MIPYSRKGSAGSKTQKISSTSDGMMVSSTANQFAILVSCRCNFTGTMGHLMTYLLC